MPADKVKHKPFMERGRKEKAKGRKEQAKGRKEKAKGRKETSPTKERKESSPTTNERKESNPMNSDYAKNVSCHICLTRGDHPSFTCPYRLRYPAGAVIGRFAEIRCLCCGEAKPHKGRPGIAWKARVVLKPSYSYPSVEEELEELNKASTSKAAVDGTGNLRRAPK